MARERERERASTNENGENAPKQMTLHFAPALWPFTRASNEYVKLAFGASGARVTQRIDLNSDGSAVFLTVPLAVFTVTNGRADHVFPSIVNCTAAPPSFALPGR